jgi:hypothetical protein
MGGEMADRPVVARKFEPMKAGDSVEGKTRMSVRLVVQPASTPKRGRRGKGDVLRQSGDRKRLKRTDVKIGCKIPNIIG